MKRFQGWMARAEDRLVTALELVPEALPDGLARLEGRLRDMPITLVCKAYSGPRVRWARFVHVGGPTLDIANVLVVPKAALGAPILGADLVDVGRGGLLAVADLSPVLPDEASRRAVEEALPPAPCDALPAWAGKIFGPRPLSARSPPLAENVMEASFERYVAACEALVRRAVNAPEDVVSAFHARYMQIHREEDRGLAMLGAMVGAEQARALLEDVMFPVALK